MSKDDRDKHPSIQLKQPKLTLENGRCYLQFEFSSDSDKEKFQYVATQNELVVDIPSDWASHLHYLLTNALFEMMASNHGMPKDYYGYESLPF